MTDILEAYLTHPIEREYESWIIEEIEGYLDTVGIPNQIIALSPHDEKWIPVDELAAFEGKVIGLQFKRPKLAPTRLPTPPKFSRLYWDLSNPPGQLKQLLQFPEVYYCLPTFINRNYKHAALEHCLFWRPSDEKRKMTWYENPRAQKGKSHPVLKTAMRWGLFIEGIVACDIGAQLGPGGLASYVESRLRELILREVLYLLHIGMNPSR